MRRTRRFAGAVLLAGLAVPVMGVANPPEGCLRLAERRELAQRAPQRVMRLEALDWCAMDDGRWTVIRRRGVEVDGVLSGASTDEVLVIWIPSSAPEGGKE